MEDGLRRLHRRVPGREPVLKEEGGGRRERAAAVGLALSAILVSFWLFPPGRFYWSGHEAIYGALLRGEPLPDDATGWTTGPVARAVATVLHAVFGEHAERLWLLGQRLSTPAFALAAAMLARPLGGSFGMATAALVALCHPGPWVWGATGYPVVAATTLGGFGLAVAQRGSAWGGALLVLLAAFVRVEAAIFLLPFGLRPWRPREGGWTPLRALAGAAAVLLVLAWAGGQDPLATAVGPWFGGLDPIGLLTGHLAMLSTGGPLFAAEIGPLLVLVLVASWRRRGAVFCFCLPFAVVTPLWLVDFGPRHLLPAILLGSALVGTLVVPGPTQEPGVAPGVGWRLQPALVAAFGAFALVGFHSITVPTLADLSGRYGAEAAFLREGLPTISGLPSVDARCLVLAPGGSALWPAAVDLENALVVAEEAVLKAPACVVLLAGTGAVVSGDARWEVLLTLGDAFGLRPSGLLSAGAAGDLWVTWSAAP